MCPNQIKKHPVGVFFYLVFARTAQINLRICAAKHYQCFVTISENQQISQNGNGGPPIPPCVPQPPFASVTMRWQAGAEQITRRSATRSFNEVWLTLLYLSTRQFGGIFFIYNPLPFASVTMQRDVSRTSIKNKIPRMRAG